MADIEEGLDELQSKKDALVKEAAELETKVTESRAAAEEMAKKNEALAQEQKRVMELIEAARKDKNNVSQFESRLREENLQKAKQKFIKDYGYEGNVEKIKTLEDAFQRVDSQSLTDERIYDDFLTAHVRLNRDTYLNLERETKERQEQAERLKVDQSSSATLGLQPSNIESVSLTDDDIKVANWAHIPLDKMKELKAKGKIY